MACKLRYQCLIIYPNAWINIQSGSIGSIPLCQTGFGARGGGVVKFSIVTEHDGEDLLSNIVTVTT